jgi:Fe2+ or Zn2+ uptake regulation protein
MGVRGLNVSRMTGTIGIGPLTDYPRRLRAAGLRVTRPRMAVLHVVYQNPHSNTETIVRAVRNCLPDGSRQTVYDILSALTHVGLLRRVQPAGSVGLYETRVGDNHHHVVCRSCRAIADVDCAIGQKSCVTASDVKGFHLDEAEVIYWGRCPACAASDVAHVNGDHSPAEWLVPAPLAPMTVLTSGRIGSGGFGASSGWASHDDADVTSERRRDLFHALGHDD